MDEQYTYQTPLQHRGDDLLVEDKDFAVVYNGSVGGTYEVMLKYSEQEVRDHINRYGIDRASVDVKELAKDMVVEQFAKLTHQRMPVFEMPNGDILYARTTGRRMRSMWEVYAMRVLPCGTASHTTTIRRSMPTCRP